MPSPKRSELLRRVLRETSSVYLRINATDNGWCGVIDSTIKSSVFKSEDKDIEVISGELHDFIIKNREKSSKNGKKSFVFISND